MDKDSEQLSDTCTQTNQAIPTTSPANKRSSRSLMRDNSSNLQQISSSQAQFESKMKNSFSKFINNDSTLFASTKSGLGHSQPRLNQIKSQKFIQLNMRVCQKTKVTPA